MPIFEAIIGAVVGEVAKHVTRRVLDDPEGTQKVIKGAFQTVTSSPGGEYKSQQHNQSEVSDADQSCVFCGTSSTFYNLGSYCPKAAKGGVHQWEANDHGTRTLPEIAGWGD